MQVKKVSQAALSTDLIRRPWKDVPSQPIGIELSAEYDNDK